MYRIENVAGDASTRVSRKTSGVGRKSRTRLYRFLGRRIVPRRSLLITDGIYEAHRVRLDEDAKVGLIRLIHIPSANGHTPAEPEVVEVMAEEPDDFTEDALEGDEDDPADMTAETVPAEAVEGLADEVAMVDDAQVVSVSDIPDEALLREMAWTDLKKLAKDHGVRAKAKDDILSKLLSLRG